MFAYVDGRVHRNWNKKGFDSIICHKLPWSQLYLLDVLYEMLSVFEMVWGLANQGANDVGQLLDHSICDRPPTGHNGPEEGANFLDFGKAIKLRDNCTSGVHFSVTVVTESSLAFDVLECWGKFIFQFVSRVLGDGLVSVVSASKD